LNLDENLHVRETPDAGFGQREIKEGRYGIGKRTIAVARQNFHVAGSSPLRQCQNSPNRGDSYQPHKGM
jgi:hypothetical protein